MKKVFSVFMIFFAVFLVSCGGLLDEDSTNTVRITMPGNARSASAGGPEDVDHYNIQIASQSFSIVPPGSTVESAPLPVGMSISISVEAIGKIKDNGQDVDSGRRVAYYQTSERLPAEGLTLNVNMANYKTEYHKVTLYPNGFNSREPEEVYIADGSSYTLPNYGPSQSSSGGAPQKHTGWTYGQTGKVAVGESITINSDMTFMLETGDDDSYARFEFRAIGAIGTNIERFQSFSTWKAEDYVKKGTSYELPDFSDPSHYITVLYSTVHGRDLYTAIKHSGWTGVSTTGGSPTSETYKPGQTVENIQGDITFIIKTINSTAINVVTAGGGTGITITEPLPTGIYRFPNQLAGVNGDFIIWSDESFTAPSATKQDGSSVTMWELKVSGETIKTISPGTSVTNDEWLQAVEKKSDNDVLQLYASD